MKIILPILTTSILVALSGSLFSANSSFIQSPLVNTGVDADASGRVLSSLTAKRSEIQIAVFKLAPSESYVVEVGGVAETTFTTNRAGKAKVRFRGPNAGKGPLLDFDPRGKVLRIVKEGTSVLEATLSGADEPTGALVLERANLALGAAPGTTGKASAEYRLDKKGRRTFKVELERAGAGPFELWVGGVKKGDFKTAGIFARIKFSVGKDDVGELPLDFDPRGQLVEVIRNGEVVFSSEMAAQAQSVNVASPRLVASGIPSTGADVDGHAEAKLRVDDRARKHFSVEIEDVPAGTYELLVDGASVGQIVVVADASGTSGELEFTSGDDDASELPLTFDPTGKTLTVQQGGVVFFEGVFNNDPGNGSGVPAPEAPSELQELLGSTGLDADGTARARYRVDSKGRHKFNVEVKNLPVGSYTLLVAGENRGIIRVAATIAGVVGQIEFDSKLEPGHRPLVFDPRGQLIEIVSPSGTYFSQILGSGTPVTSGGNGSGGNDDPAGDDHGSGGHGGDDPAGDDHGSGGHGADD